MNKTKYIEENTTFVVNSIISDSVNMTCTQCSYVKTSSFSNIKKAKNYSCEQCILNEKKIYIENNTTFTVNSINGDNTNITCVVCTHNRNAKFSHIKRSSNYKCSNCENNEKIKYITENTNFYVNSISGETTNITCNKCKHNKVVRFSDIKRSPNYKCNKCNINEQITLIKKQTEFDCELIEHGQATIFCTVCNNKKIVKFSDIKKSNNYKCEGCNIQQKIKHIAENTNFTYISFGQDDVNVVNNVNNVNVVCDTCNHPKSVKLNDIKRLHKSPCSNCENNKKTKYVEQHTQFKVNCVRGEYIDITCSVCNCVKENVNFINIKRSNNYNCEQCEYNKKLEIFKQSNMTYLERIDYNYKLKCNKCEHIDLYTYHNSLKVKDIITCKKCARYLSGEEHKLNEFLISLGLVEDKDYFINYSNKDITELDFYFPEFKFAIEINGLAWHSIPGIILNGKATKTDEFKTKHREKYLYCRNNNIFLLQVTDYDVKNKFHIISSMIKEKLNLLDIVIEVDTINIKEVSLTTALDFHNDNHILGSFSETESTHRIGLHYNEELVFLATLDTTNSQDKNEVILIRFCNKINTNVPKALNKLLSYIIDTLGYNNITTVSNNMYSDFSFYEHNNFKSIENSEGSEGSENNIDYEYTNRTFNQLMCKSVYTSEYNSEYTSEKEFMDKNNYSKYYDAGSTKWELRS